MSNDQDKFELDGPVIDFLTPHECLLGDHQFVAAIGLYVHALLRVERCAQAIGVSFDRVLACYMALALEMAKQEQPQFAGILHPRPIILAVEALAGSVPLRYNLSKVVSMCPQRSLFHNEFDWWKGYTASKAGQDNYAMSCTEIAKWRRVSQMEGFEIAPVFPENHNL